MVNRTVQAAQDIFSSIFSDTEVFPGFDPVKRQKVELMYTTVSGGKSREKGILLKIGSGNNLDLKETAKHIWATALHCWGTRWS